MPSSKSLVAERQFSYTSEDFQWPSRNDESQFEPSNVSTCSRDFLADAHQMHIMPGEPKAQILSGNTTLQL